MKNRVQSIFSLLFLFAFFGAGTFTAQPDLSSFSSFKDLDLNKLAQGDVLAARGALMNFRRGLFVETCFVVHAPPEKALRNLLAWDPSQHESLELYGHHNIAIPLTPESFVALNSLPENRPVKALFYSTLHQNVSQPDLQISKADAAFFKLDQPVTEQNGKEVFTSIWTNVMTQLANRFLQGGDGQFPTYENGGETIKISEELHNLLAESGPVLNHFQPLLSGTPLGKLMGLSESAPLNPTPYWEVQNVETMAAIDLGSIYSLPVENGWQMLDCEYYVSSGYLCSMILYQGWPVTIGSEQATLIWRGDFVSAPAIAYTHGVERVATGMIMLQDIKKTDGYFQKDLLKMP